MKRIKTLLLIVMISLAVFAAGFAFVSVHVYHRSIGASLMELRLQSKNSTRVFETAQMRKNTCSGGQNQKTSGMNCRKTCRLKVR